MSDRPVFTENNRIFVSAGVLLYTKDTQGIYSFMMQKTQNRGSWIYEDLGGKSDPNDKSIKDVAFRECLEELNFKGGITRDYLEQQLLDPHSITYSVVDNKYMLYIIYVPYEIKAKMNMNEFGDHELLDGVPRTVTWLSYRDFMSLDSKDLHPRFKPDELRDNLPLLIARNLIKN
jgi:8-oxo-dGTP pyrophosphatase MutT (NUDIX family)